MAAAASEVAAPPVCVLVLGMAGSGKTTFVQVRGGWGELLVYLSATPVSGGD